MVLYSVLFLILAALAPPLILLGIIYRLDQIEREPPWPALVPLPAGGADHGSHSGAGDAGRPVIDFFYWRPMVYLFLAYFVVPGFIEEGIKYRVLRRRTWNEPNFNYASTGWSTGCSSPWLCRGGERDVRSQLRLSTAVVRAISPSRPRHVRGGDGI